MGESLIQNLSGWAEDKFASICAAAGVTRNKSTHDVSGWDYLIQFPGTQIKGVPHDLLPGEISARIQVKSKANAPATVQLKLSNAIKFAKEEVPCFVVLFLATGQKEPVRIYCKHIWKDEIAAALKRAREASRDGQNNLNRLKVSFNFTASDEHTHDLIEWMQSVIKSNGPDYSHNKKALNKTLGFEGGAVVGSVSFGADLGEIVDHQIGLVPHINVEHISLKAQRFGIEGPALFSGKPTLFSMKAHPRPCRLRLYGLEGADIWLDGQLFLPSVPNLPKDLQKVRIVADFIEMVVSSSNTSTFTLKNDPKTQRTLPEWRSFVDAMRLIEADQTLFDILVEEKILFNGALPSLEAPFEYTHQFLNIIACLEAVTHGRLPSNLTISTEEIFRAWNHIVEFNGLVTGTDMAVSMTADWSADPGDITSASIYFYGWVQIAQWAFLAVVRRAAPEVDFKSKIAQVKFGAPKVIEAIIRQGGIEEYQEQIISIYNRIKNNEPKKAILELWDGNFHTACKAGSQ